jgi:hypothetical protein
MVLEGNVAWLGGTLMPEAKKNLDQQKSDLRLEGFEQIFDETLEAQEQSATESGEPTSATNTPEIGKLLERFTEVVAMSVDQRIENARLSGQLIENQRQLVATQQILIRLMEKSIDLTRHISEIEEKLPTVFALPRTVESIRERLVKLEGVELD